jgi:putative ABC transport system permease protein
MEFTEIIAYAASAIKLRKLRAGLTILGIAIGITALVGLLAITQGFQISLKAQLQRGFATDTIVVTNQNLGFGYELKDFELFIDDAEIIERIDNVKQTIPMLQKNCYGNFSNYTIPISVVGVDFAKYKSVYPESFKASAGSISSYDNQSVAVIGKSVNDPWQNGTLLAEINRDFEILYTTRIDFEFVNETSPFKCIAILDEIGGATVGGPSDYSVYVPLERAKSFFNTTETSTIVVQVEQSDEESIAQTSKKIEDAFDSQILVVSSASIYKTISSVMDQVQVLMTGVIAISLLVAGVGIMNIMIISLMERTREIGIMKAIGMKDGTVLAIFLSESLIMGLVGTLSGIGFGYLLALGVNNLDLLGGMISSATEGTVMGGIPSTPILTTTNLLSALFFGIAVSILFGIYPAWRASRLEPVDALRYE